MFNVPNPFPLADTAESKRRLVFGCLMQYTAESIPLRDRALEGAVLVALVGSSQDKAFKNGDVLRNLRGGNVDLRPEVIRVTLGRLIEKGLVEQAELRSKTVYFLTEQGELRIVEGAREAKSLFLPVLAEVLEHAVDSLDAMQAEEVLEDFICTSFARFGASIAGYLVGRSSQFANLFELSVTFDEVATRHGVPADLRESLKVRCMGVFRARSPASRRLMFHLTQGYCFAQLLGVDRGDFNPIAEEAFKGAVFYFDTNVLFAGLLPGDGGASFAEILSIARRIGIQLRVTRATVEEARHAAAGKLATLNKIADAVPEELGERSADEFVVHFFELRHENPSLQPADFLRDFESIADVARERWGVDLEEVTAEGLLEGVDTSAVGESLQSAALASRGYKKSLPVLLHDLAHLELVRKERVALVKTWFLTRDRALINADAEMARSNGPGGKPLCFSVLGFLQSISPFVSSSSEEDVLANFFSGLLSEQVFVSEKLFDDRELALVAEMHADVMAMPPDQVVIAVDYIKKQILRGERYRVEEVPLVALELRKFLSANAEEKLRMLEQLAAENNDKYQAARREMERERLLREQYEAQLQRTEEDLERAKSDSAAQRDEMVSVRRDADARAGKLRRLIWTIVSLFLGVEVGHFGAQARVLVGNSFHLGQLGVARVEVGLRLLMIGFFLLPLIFFIPRKRLGPDVRTATIALVVILWFIFAGVQSSEVMADFSTVATVALYIGLFLSDRKE